MIELDPSLLSFNGTRFKAVELDDQFWLRADELGLALGLESPEHAALALYQNHFDQFSERLTALSGVETATGPRQMRVFNLLGAYVLCTFLDTMQSRTVRRWLLETLVYLQIDVRREIRRLIEEDRVLRELIRALREDVEILKAKLRELQEKFEFTTAIETEFDRVVEQQERQTGLLAKLIEVYKSTPAPDYLEGNFQRMFEEQATLIQVLADEVKASRSALVPVPGDSLGPPRVWSLDGPLPVYLGEIGGRTCLVVGSRDLIGCLFGDAPLADGWYKFVVGTDLENSPLREGTDYVELYWNHPPFDPERSGWHNGAYHLSLEAAQCIARKYVSSDVGHKASALIDYLDECQRRLDELGVDAIRPASPPSHREEGLMTLDFGGTPLRIVMREGDPWFIAAEVCGVLGIQNVTQAVDPLDEDERSMFNIGRQGNVNIISYSGLSTLIIRCRDALKPGTTAYQFRCWVTKDVLPAIYKTGRYEHAAYHSIDPIDGKTANPALSSAKTTGKTPTGTQPSGNRPKPRGRK